MNHNADPATEAEDEAPLALLEAEVFEESTTSICYVFAQPTL